MYSQHKNISVVICTYNRVKFIEGALKSLFNQTLPKSQYEVIVVNNNCTDGTEKVVNDFIAAHPEMDMRQVTETNQGLSFARNRGIKEAKYDIINFIDDDGVAKEDFLSIALTFFNENAHAVGAGGKVIPIYETEEPAWYNPYLRMMVTSIDFGEKMFKSKGKKYPAGCNMTYLKSILEQAGGFNNDLKWRADDKYIFKQVAKLNNSIYYYPKLIVHHHIDADRITDANFDRLSGLLGSEERLRVSKIGILPYFFKLLEFVFKYFASLIIALGYLVRGQWIKGRYVIRFRWLALLRYLNL